VKSHRQIFRSSAIIGGASVINILVGIIKVKMLAILLGPAGVGLMGLYQSIMGTASTLVGCGLDTSGVRQIVLSQGNQKVLALVRRALLWGNTLLGGLAMVLLWMARDPIAKLVFHDANHTAEVGWLGIGVLLTLLSSSQMALLQGMRRVGDVARVNIFGSLVGTAFGVLLVWCLGYEGVHWFVISAPLASAIFSSWYASRLQINEVEPDWMVLRQQWQAMLSMGLPLMAAALLTLVTQLIARTMVMRDLGLDASGYFQAAWAISMTYIGFVLGAMGVDYLPRLTEVIDDRKRAKQLVSEQTEMALLMAAPILLAMITFAPWLIEIFYTKSFAPAAEILRWQVMGDIFKVIGWPMGFIVLAQGRGDVFIATQLNWNLIYLLCVWFGISEIGLLVVGVAFFVAYVVQVGLIRVVVGRLIGYTTKSSSLGMFAMLLICAGVILVIGKYWAFVALLLGTVFTMLFACYSFFQLDKLVGLNSFICGVIGRLK